MRIKVKPSIKPFSRRWVRRYAWRPMFDYENNQWVWLEHFIDAQNWWHWWWRTRRDEFPHMLATPIVRDDRRSRA